MVELGFPDGYSVRHALAQLVGVESDDLAAQAERDDGWARRRDAYDGGCRPCKVKPAATDDGCLCSGER